MHARRLIGLSLSSCAAVIALAVGTLAQSGTSNFDTRQPTTIRSDPPDILELESGLYLVRSDGTIGLGIYGSPIVAGKTLEEAKVVIAQKFASRIKRYDAKKLEVSILPYKDNCYYIVKDEGKYGQQVIRVPVTGNETVLDVFAMVGGLSKKRIRVVRRSPTGDQVLPVDWQAITQQGNNATNYEVLSGDRIYVDDKVTRIGRMLNPVETCLGVTLLEDSVVKPYASQKE